MIPAWNIHRCCLGCVVVAGSLHGCHHLSVGGASDYRVIHGLIFGLTVDQSFIACRTNNMSDTKWDKLQSHKERQHRHLQGNRASHDDFLLSNFGVLIAFINVWPPAVYTTVTLSSTVKACLTLETKEPAHFCAHQVPPLPTLHA